MKLWAIPTNLLLAGVGVAAPVQAQADFDDRQVLAALEDTLLHDPFVPSNGIDIEIERGVVALRGSVPHLLAKERSTNLAELVRGVRSVHNQLEVRPARAIPAAELEADIRTALEEDPAIEALELTLAVEEGGTVTLVGRVDSWGERELAEAVTKGVRGVTSLVSEVRVDPAKRRPDDEIEADIEGLLRGNIYIDDELIDIDVSAGVVRLSGVVASAAEKTRVRIYAYRAGADTLEDALEVAHWTRDRSFRGGKYESIRDDQTHAAIVRSLRVDPRVDGAKVDVDVVDGVATLSGVVSSLRARRAASQNVTETVGVRRVKNHLKVRPLTRDDVELAASVASAIRRDPLVERFGVAVLARGGVVFLDGTVDSHVERSQAEEVAARVRGVVDVVSVLTVRRDNPVEVEPSTELQGLSTLSVYETALPRTTHYRDEVVEANIEDLLRWSVYVNANRVSVSVENGVATLQGDVGSIGEQGIARRIAIAGGAKDVRNLLAVEAQAVEASYVR